MGVDSEVKESVKIQSKSNIKEPKQFRVIYVNDNVTTMEFVIESLVTVFNHDLITAHEITEKIHTDGSAVVAVLPYEMAEQRGIEVTMMARNQGYPLQIKLEPDV